MPILPSPILKSGSGEKPGQDFGNNRIDSRAAWEAHYTHRLGGYASLRVPVKLRSSETVAATHVAAETPCSNPAHGTPLQLAFVHSKRYAESLRNRWREPFLVCVLKGCRHDRR